MNINSIRISLFILLLILLSLKTVLVLMLKSYENKKIKILHLINSEIKTTEELNILIKNLNKLIERKNGDV